MNNDVKNLIAHVVAHIGQNAKASKYNSTNKDFKKQHGIELEGAPMVYHDGEERVIFLVLNAPQMPYGKKLRQKSEYVWYCRMSDIPEDVKHLIPLRKDITR